MKNWENIFQDKIKKIATSDDPAHDLLHFQRVVKTAKQICEFERGCFEEVIPAAWLHDFVIVPKDSPLRSQASKISAEAAINFLKEIKYPHQFYDNIFHAIEAHSFSANRQTQTLESKIVQDADRLDGLGAIGIARCFATAGLLKRPFYSSEDPFCKNRPPDDSLYTVDHFYKKLFKVAESLKTKTGQELGIKRVENMKQYLHALELEL